jgi:HEPN domain-containing protein
MTPLSKKYDPSYALVLIRIARGEVDTARTLLEGVKRNQPVRPEVVGFLAQQAIEKGLKAVLCHRGLPLPLSHDLSALAAALPNDVARPPHETILSALNEFATIRRYEEGYEILSWKELEEAVQLAHILLQWSENTVLPKK